MQRFTAEMMVSGLVTKGKWFLALQGACFALFLLLLAADPAAGQDSEPIKLLTHTVQKGETLRSVAEYYYANAGRWPEIQHFNRIEDPRKMYAGQEIEVPFYKKHVWNNFCARIGEPSLKMVDGAEQDVGPAQGTPATTKRSKARIALYTCGYIAAVLVLAAFLRHYSMGQTGRRLRQSDRRYRR